MDGRRPTVVNWGSPTPLETDEPAAIDDELFDADEPDDANEPDETESST
jgi:hypothetical protein